MDTAISILAFAEGKREFSCLNEYKQIRGEQRYKLGIDLGFSNAFPHTTFPT